MKNPASSLPTLADIEAAAQLIYQDFPATPQYRWALLGAIQIAVSAGINALLVLFAGGVSGFLNRSPRWVNAQRYLMGSVLGLLALRILNEKKPT